MCAEICSEDLYFPYIFSLWNIGHKVVVEDKENNKAVVTFKKLRHDSHTHEVIFYPDMIELEYESITNPGLVNYIYFLMFQIDLSWMNQVIRKVRNPFSLEYMCMWKVPLTGQHESILRRHLNVSPVDVLREYQQLEFLGKRSSVYDASTAITNYIKCRSKKSHLETDIYSIEFNFDIFYYETNHRDLFSLLSLECFLFQNTHKWVKVLNDVYMCTIECFHIVCQYFYYNAPFALVPTQMCETYEEFDICSKCSYQRFATNGYRDLLVLSEYFPLKQINFRFQKVKSLKDLSENVLIIQIMLLRMVILSYANAANHISRNEIEKQNSCTEYVQTMNKVKEYLEKKDMTYRTGLVHGKKHMNVSTNCFLIDIHRKAMLVPVGILKYIIGRYLHNRKYLSESQSSKILSVCW